MKTYLTLNKKNLITDEVTEYSTLEETFRSLPIADNAQITLFKIDAYKHDLLPGISFTVDKEVFYRPSGFGITMYENCSGISIQTGWAFFYCTRLMMYCPDNKIAIDSHINFETKDIPTLINNEIHHLDELLIAKGVDLTKRRILIMPGYMPSPGHHLTESPPGVILFNELKKCGLIAESIVLFDHTMDECKLNLNNGEYTYNVDEKIDNVNVDEKISKVIPTTKDENEINNIEDLGDFLFSYFDDVKDEFNRTPKNPSVYQGNLPIFNKKRSQSDQSDDEQSKIVEDTINKRQKLK